MDHLGLYHRRGQLDDAQLWAGRTLQSDWEDQGRARSAGAPPLELDRVDHVTRYEPKLDGGGARVAAAMRGVGRTLWPVLVWVAIEGGSATGWARAVSRPDEDGMAVLRVALDALSAHYEAMAAAVLR